ncbi:nucleoporin complex subunit 54-domain-containing protein [Scheffersomyces coipomensis]|uniref:nucleoporin complex subunit 54-domain-containing protein n=1 Tax=Scheffersomyces coipomensis TaxID=1788519 RepID=UPI00315DC171
MFSTGGNTGQGTFGSANANSGLFGSKPAGTGFGSTGATGQTPLFGAPNPNTGTSGGLFGQSNTNTSNGLFGNTNTAANNNNTTGTGLFGSNATGNAQNTGFGAANNNNTASNGLFGQASGNTSGGLFGKPASTGTGLFGSAQTANNLGPTDKPVGTQGGLFGNKAASSTGLFGSTGTTTAQNTGTGLFGSSNTATTGTSGGLFGGNIASTSSNLFGQNPQQQQQQPQQQQQQQQQQQSTGLFGNNTTNNAQPSFGWTSNQSQKPSFNTTATTLNSTNINGNTITSNTNTNTYTPAINDQLEKIKEQWDPNSAKCVLKTHFYNKFSDQEIQILLNQQRPSNETPEDWDAAMSKRPSANSYPIKITSFTDVAQRIEVQLDHVAKSRILLNNINEKQNALSSKHDLENTTRILRAKARHTKLSRRLLRLATVLAILKLKGYPLLPEEEEISKQFEVLSSKLSDPNSPIGKLNDVFARLAILKERAEDLNFQFDSSLNALNGISSEEIHDQSGADQKNTDEIVKKLSEVLLKQQIGLNYLNEVLEKDTNTVDNISR